MTRRPYSFRGGVPSPDGSKTWKWSTGLDLYCGDQALNTLVSAGMLTVEQASLVRQDPAAAFANPRITQAISMLSRRSGGEPPDFEKIVDMHRNMDFSPAKGRQNSAFDHTCGEQGRTGLSHLGAKAGIQFRFDVDFTWHPVESQRSLIWAGKFSKQEAFVDVLARKHFEEATSVNHRTTLLSVAAEIGLNSEALSEYLDSDEGAEEVWTSYRETNEKHAIHSIPYFVFNGPTTNDGPFRGEGRALHTVNGSASVDEFLAVFEAIMAEGWPGDDPPQSQAILGVASEKRSDGFKRGFLIR